MRIQVMRNYDRIETVDVRNLRQLIASGQILAFRRASGWVKIGTETMRGDGGREYGGPERREVQQKPLSEAQKRDGHYCVIGVTGPDTDW